MKRFCISIFLFIFVLPVFAASWVLIPGTTIVYDSENIKREDFGISTVQTKTPTKDGYEMINTTLINCSTKQFNTREVKLFDPSKNKVVYRQFMQPDWTIIPQNSNIDYLYQKVCY